MRTDQEALEIVKKALTETDPTIHVFDPEYDLKGYYGFDSVDMNVFAWELEKELGFEITDEDVKNRLSGTIAECIKFIQELIL